MKGTPQIISTLNVLLIDELTAISESMVHSEMCANWGYERLPQATEKHAHDEMKHAEQRIRRILFLEGMPLACKLNELHSGTDVAAQLKNDDAAEAGAIKKYNNAIRQAVELDDNGFHPIFI